MIDEKEASRAFCNIIDAMSEDLFSMSPEELADEAAFLPATREICWGFIVNREYRKSLLAREPSSSDLSPK